VHGAIAIGEASVFKRKATQVYRREIADPAHEIKRLRAAKEKALAQLTSVYEKALSEIGAANAQIFEIHRMMLEDDDYNESIVNIIESQRVNAEYAVALTRDSFAQMFSSTEDSYMQARASDVRDISNRMIACFEKESEPDRVSGAKVILCADDLAPSETVLLDKESVLAFVTEQGTQNSHTAILARNMNIPAVVGVGEGFLAQIEEGALMTVDGYSGEVVLSPDVAKLEEGRKKQRLDLEKKALLQSLKGKEDITLDGKRIHIFANIGSVDQIGAVLANDAGGIGLFRSEFLYLERDRYPSEEELFSAYRKVLLSMGRKKVIVRTLDIGADKQVDYFEMEREENPALGLRALRLYLTRPALFKTQMRALYRASVYGVLGIMFPMITSVWELEAVLSLCEEVKEELRREGLEYSDGVEIGIMIETPAAAIISDRLAPLVDFFSVGTNDLIQYTLACDRQNPSLEQFCDPHHEAILRLIELSAQNAHKNGAWIGICGELAADPTLTEAFLRMGIDELSVSPGYVLKMRDTVRRIDLSQKGQI
jgi:phosphotransferase system enzyme I (PtsI)